MNETKKEDLPKGTFAVLAGLIGLSRKANPILKPKIKLKYTGQQVAEYINKSYTRTHEILKTLSGKTIACFDKNRVVLRKPVLYTEEIQLNATGRPTVFYQPSSEIVGWYYTQYPEELEKEYRDAIKKVEEEDERINTKRR